MIGDTILVVTLCAKPQARFETAMKKILSAMILSMTPFSPIRAQDAPLPPRVAAKAMTLPPGFKATLFAGEPDVVQPIAFCFDDRGRLWVAECLSYPNWQPDPKAGKDRIVIFEEGDNGAFSKRTVFADNIQNISGINYGFGGIWVCATPNLLFIPVKDPVPNAPKRAGKPEPQTKPAGPAQIVLDGWSLKASHNVFNSLTWGPDGWLYGCNGIVATSRVGRPGTPDKDRVPINCGVWRYHPTKKKFEAVAHGTTNPWGLDFDEHGEMFITNCVIDHLWHVVPGAHYQRMYGNDLNPHVYKLMPSICDHIHWGGGSWTSSRHPTASKNANDDAYKVHSEAGGGHAHVGCMIYLGDNWPDRYRGGVFMCNLHGNRINHDILERNGSTYVARHGKDFMLANDPWFRGLALAYGPDGGVYVSDWTDTGECHNYKVVDRTNGRIFKITYGDVKPWKGDLAKLSDLELAKLQASKNEWMVRHARRILQERAVDRKIAPEAVKSLKDELFKEELLLTNSQRERAVSKKLRSLWTLFVTKNLDDETFDQFLDLNNEPLRVWAVRILMEKDIVSKETLGQLSHILRLSTPLVRLHIASGIQKKNVDFGVSFGIGSRLTSGFESDVSDPYLPLMYWYAVEPVMAKKPFFGVICLHEIRIPLVRENICRRIAANQDDQETFDGLMREVAREDQPAVHRDVLRGVQEGLSGRRQVKMPKAWQKTYPILIESPLPEVRERALALAVQFGDERAFTLLRKIVPDRALAVKQREDALKTLLFQQKADLVPILHELLNDEQLRGPAIRGLAAFDDARTPRLLLEKYPRLSADEKSDAIQTLSARASYVKELVAALENKLIPRADLNSYTIRQLHTVLARSGDRAATEALTKVVGAIRPASADKAKLMAKYKAELTPATLKKANLSNGRVLFTKACASCHRLFGEGGDIGPDLTGAQRTNLDYVLENVLDPSAIVPKEYQVTVVVTTAGRTLSGIVKKESDAALTLQLPNEVVVLPKGEIESREATKLSMMPEGIFEPLRLEEVRDLVGYLASPVQVPMKK
jgi:putative membrane-bound dehydrogenase-like protein